MISLAAYGEFEALDAVAYHVESSGCPTTYAEWNLWRENLLRAPDSPDALIGDPGDLLERCAQEKSQASFFSDPKFVACMGPLRRAQAVLHAFRIGGENTLHGLVKTPDAPLGKNGSALDELPAGLNDSAAFEKVAKGMSEGAKTPGLFEIFDAKKPKANALISQVLKKMPAGWAAFTYKSRLVHRGGAIFFKDSGDTVQVLHFDEGDSRDAIGITMKVKDENGKWIVPPQTYFNVYQIGFGGGVARKEDQTSRCIVCHRAGLMPVVVESSGSVLSYDPAHDSDEILRWFNRDFADSLSNASVAGSYTLDIGVPELGEKPHPGRTDAFIKECAEKSGVSLSASGRENVRNAMNCARCHDGQPLGAGLVAYAGSPHNFFGQTIENLIEGGEMPPKGKLSSSERKALVGCLRYEYYGGFKNKEYGGGPSPGTFLRAMKEVACPTTAPPESKRVVDLKVKPTNRVAPKRIPSSKSGSKKAGDAG